jgi:hypothetical protein
MNDVVPAPEPLADRLGRPTDGALVGHVGDHLHHPGPARGRERLVDLGECRRAIDDGNLGPLRGEGVGDRPPESPGSSHHHGDVTGNSQVHVQTLPGPSGAAAPMPAD